MDSKVQNVINEEKVLIRKKINIVLYSLIASFGFIFGMIFSLYYSFFKIHFLNQI